LKAEHKKQLLITTFLVALFCAGGAVLVVLGCESYQDSREFVAGARAAPGVVYDFDIYDAPGGDISDDIWYAMVRYTTSDGREVRFRGPSRDGLVKLNKGDDVRVLYYSDNPEQARVDSFMGLWFAATMLWVVGLGAILIPLLTLREAWKWAVAQGGA